MGTGNPILVSGFSNGTGNTINQLLVNHTSFVQTVNYIITPAFGDCNGDPVIYAVTVNPVYTVNVTISASPDTICTGNPVTYTAVANNGGTTPVYQWKVNGINSEPIPQFSFILH